MDTVELIQFSLSSATSILKQVTADLTQEQADWTPPGVANSIGTLYWHVISGTDQVVHGWGMGEAPLSQKEGWQEKVILSTSEGDEKHAAHMQTVRVDLPVMHEYTEAVAKAALDWVATLSPDDLERKIDTPLGEFNLGQVLVTFGSWHINAHCGEISALKGCQGATGYPF